MKKFDSLFIKGIAVILVPVIIILIFVALVTNATLSKKTELNDLPIDSKEIVYDTVKIKEIVYDTIKISIKPKEKPVTLPTEIKIDTAIK